MWAYEQNLMAADNARLAIIKQGEIILALGNISNVFSLGLRGHMKFSPNDYIPPPTNDTS